MYLLYHHALPHGKFEDVKKAITLYNNEQYTEFVVETNNRKALIFKCKNGVNLRSESDGTRPKQHCYFLGCTASIYLYKSQKTDNQVIKVTRVNLEHIHIVNEHKSNEH